MSGTIARRKPTKADCVGCRDDFYNQPGNSTDGVCWSLASATIVLRRQVPIMERPPHRQTPKPVPSCYRRPGFVYMKPEGER
jgi:hypothetical protein